MPPRRPHRRHVSSRALGVVVVVVGLLVLAGCGSGSGSTPSGSSSVEEFSPPGDIPDDQVFVAYTPPGSAFSVKVPEGWARSSEGQAVTFTDKLNSVRLEAVPAESAPTVESATSQEVSDIAASTRGYSPGDVTKVDRDAGPAVLITYEEDSAVDPVTDKVVRDAVERYEFWRHGTEVVLTLSGPVGADNVDPWLIVSQSFTWQ